MINDSDINTDRPPRRGLWWLLAGLLLLAAPLATTAAAQDQDPGDWEFRVCADPDNLPFSHDEEEGFELEIARILADEMGARLTVDWYPQTDDMVRLRLRAGHCDAIIGIPEGVGNVMHTVAYYRSPYVFVYRQDAPFEVDSLDDEVVAQLEIGVQNVGIPPHEALLERGLGDNVTMAFLAGRSLIGSARAIAAIDAVLEGEIDLAIVWGPVAGHLAQDYPDELVVKPVQPQFEPPFRMQSFAMTMGVRQGDEELRDRLDIALASRWDDITAVLGEWDVPLEMLPAPGVPRVRDDIVYAGFISPTVTGTDAIPESLYDVAGQAARNGALMAEGTVGTRANETGVELDVLFTSTPSPEAATRAAERLVHTWGVSALLGGTGEGQAQAIARVAREAGIPFINTGSVTLPRTCEPGIFHVEASSLDYLSAIFERYHGSDESWFIVGENTEDGTRRFELAQEALEQYGGGAQLAGSTVIEREKPSYWPVLSEIAESGATRVLSLLYARDLIPFMGQLGTSPAANVPVVPFPHPVTQGREYMAAARLSGGEAAVGERIVLWETTLEEGEAFDLNDRYMSRFAEPMDPSAWAGNAGVHILYEALVQSGSREAAGLIEALEAGTFEVGKSRELTFSGGTHQLQQPLYVIEMDPDAQWGLLLSRMVETAYLVDELVPPTVSGGEPGNCQ